MTTISYFSTAILKNVLTIITFCYIINIKGGDYYEKRGFKSKKGANTTRIKIK